jgi:DNA-directed RNA polymerase subunit K/omega
MSVKFYGDFITSKEVNEGKIDDEVHDGKDEEEEENLGYSPSDEDDDEEEMSENEIDNIDDEEDDDNYNEISIKNNGPDNHDLSGGMSKENDFENTNHAKEDGIDSDYEGSDDEEEEESEYLHDLDKSLKSNYLETVHPECFHLNYEEIKAMTFIVRDKYNNIIDPLHKTIPLMTKYEKTKVLGQRTKQIENGAVPFIPVPPNIIDSYIIAEMELKERKIPFIIRRPLPHGGSEYWKLKDLEMVSF